MARSRCRSRCRWREPRFSSKRRRRSGFLHTRFITSSSSKRDQFQLESISSGCLSLPVEKEEGKGLEREKRGAGPEQVEQPSGKKKKRRFSHFSNRRTDDDCLLFRRSSSSSVFLPFSSLFRSLRQKQQSQTPITLGIGDFRARFAPLDKEEKET